MATYTNLTDWSNVQSGDVINYTTNNLTIDATGFKFGCRLKGYSGHDTGTNVQTANAWGANCYAEFDFTNVSDGNITIGNNYGAYLAITNGTASDIKYKRIMVAGDAGMLYNSSSNYYYAGGNAGLFNSYAPQITGYNYYIYGWRTATCIGGNQTTGGTCSSYYSGTPENGTFGGTNYGKGWYSGAYITTNNGGSPRSYYTVSAGGSSYLLTSDSNKPSGYFSEWQDYVGTISNSTSALLDTDRDYYCTITILGAAPSPATHNVYRYGVVDSHSVVIPNSASDVTSTTLACTEWQFKENITPMYATPVQQADTPVDSISDYYTNDCTGYTNHENDYIIFNNTKEYLVTSASAPVIKATMNNLIQNVGIQQNFVITVGENTILDYNNLSGKRLTFGYLNDITHTAGWYWINGTFLALRITEPNYKTALDWLKDNAVLVNAGQTIQVDEHGWTQCSLKYYDGNDWVECDPMTYHNGDWE